jgi:hypothetical protein
MELELNPDAVALGLMVSNARVKKNMSLNKLADLANARRKQIMRIENGTLRNCYKGIFLDVVGCLDFTHEEREKAFILIDSYCPPGINEKTKSRRKKTFPWKRRGTPVTVWQRSQMSLRLFAYR